MSIFYWFLHVKIALLCKKNIIKSLVLRAASPRGGRAGLQAGGGGQRKRGPGGKARRQSPAGAPGRTANVHVLLVFTSQSGPNTHKPL